MLAAKPEMVRELSDMLNFGPPYADVYKAKEHVDIETASRLKEYLLGEQFAGKWYYCREDKSEVRNRMPLKQGPTHLLMVFFVFVCLEPEA